MPNLPPLNIWGTPKSYSNQEREWRKAIAAEAKEMFEQYQLLIEWNVGEQTIFEVSIEFLMSDPFAIDIDNMIKSVIDTLFLATPKQPSANRDPMPTGTLFPRVDDKHVFTDAARKRNFSPPQEQEGAIIRITWDE